MQDLNNFWNRLLLNGEMNRWKPEFIKKWCPQVIELLKECDRSFIQSKLRVDLIRINDSHVRQQNSFAKIL